MMGQPAGARPTQGSLGKFAGGLRRPPSWKARIASLRASTYWDCAPRTAAPRMSSMRRSASGRTRPGRSPKWENDCPPTYAYLRRTVHCCVLLPILDGKSPTHELTPSRHPTTSEFTALQLVEAVKEAATMTKQTRRRSAHKPRHLTLPELEQFKDFRFEHPRLFAVAPLLPARDGRIHRLVLLGTQAGVESNRRPALSHALGEHPPGSRNY